MSESVPRSSAHWLAQGLGHMAAGEAQRAAECFRQVLELEPDHPAARGYLASMEPSAEPVGPALEVDPREEPHPSDEPPASPALDAGELREEVLDLLAGGLIDEAYQLLTAMPSDGSSPMESLALVELLRTHLVDDVLMRVGSSSAAPRIEMEAKDLMKLNLPPDVGFLLSRIDGQTQVDDLVAVSGMDPFETFYNLGRLLEAGIVGVAE